MNIGDRVSHYEIMEISVAKVRTNGVVVRAEVADQGPRRGVT
jgi:hypothetical protein